MTDTETLRKLFDDSGLKFQYIAKKLGLTKQGLYKKLKDKSDWTAKQIVAARELFDLTPDQVDSIFFNKEVE